MSPDRQMSPDRTTPPHDGADAPELDGRKAAILRAVVQEYIETALPVGSGLVANAPGVEVSSATVRNEMAVLESEGFLEQPHTSAGRVPTEKGYRFFVDTLDGAPALARTQRQQITTFFSRTHGEIERMLEDTTRLLSNLTDSAAMVVAPHTEHVAVRSVQLVGLTDRVALLVVVLSTGAVDKHTVELPDSIDDGRLAAAGLRLADAMVGHPLGGRPDVTPTGDEAIDSLLDRCVDLLADDGTHEGDGVFVGGASRMASAFDAVETVKEVLDILEQQLVVVSLLEDLIDRGLSVAIGTETGMVPLSGCAVVVAPYEIGGEPAGTVGVLGPARMNYPQALAAVADVSRRLGSHLTDT
jgi:heat-inducible transcriptional repressor